MLQKIVLTGFLLGLSLAPLSAQKIQESDLIGKWSLVEKEYMNQTRENVLADKAGHTYYILNADKTCQLIYAQNTNEYKGTWQWDKRQKAIRMNIQHYEYLLKVHQLQGQRLIIKAEDGEVLYGYEHYERQN